MGTREKITEWERRVRALEAQGLTRSDAQGVVDAEDMQGGAGFKPKAATKHEIVITHTQGANLDDDGEPLDLLSYLVNELNNRNIVAHIVERAVKP